MPPKSQLFTGEALDESNFTGLPRSQPCMTRDMKPLEPRSMANPTVPDAQKVMWSDLVQGKPELEDSLSSNAKQMKVVTWT